MSTLRLFRSFVERLAGVVAWPGVMREDGWQISNGVLIFCPDAMQFSALFSEQWSSVYVAKEVFAKWESTYTCCPYFGNVKMIRLSELFYLNNDSAEKKTNAGISSCNRETCALQDEISDAYQTCAHRNTKFNLIRPDMAHSVLKEELRGRGIFCPYFFTQFLSTFLKQQS